MSSDCNCPMCRPTVVNKELVLNELPAFCAAYAIVKPDGSFVVDSRWRATSETKAFCDVLGWNMNLEKAKKGGYRFVPIKVEVLS